MTQPAVLSLIRPEVPPLPVYNAGLSSQAVRDRYGVQHVARLGSNESPFGASPQVARALAQLGGNTAFYPEAHCLELRAAIASRLEVQSGQVTIGNGSESLLQTLCLTLLGPGDTVLTQRPAFGLHEIYPRMMGATVETVDLTPALEFDVDQWCAALKRRPKLAMIANPSNPVGCMFDTEGFARLLDAASPETVLVVDEAYVEYAQHSPGYPDVLTALRGHRGPWIVLRTFSKAWGLAALRVGYGIAGDVELVDMIDRVRTPFHVNAAAQMAALAAWNDPGFMKAAAAETVRRRESLRAPLLSMGLRVAPSAANFLFVDLGRPNEAVNEGLLSRGIIVKPWKEPGFTNFLRVSVGTQEDNARFLAALTAALVH